MSEAAPGQLARITLKCGCQLKFKVGPLDGRSKYACRSGKGHGYSVAWTEWVSADGFRRVNETPEKPLCSADGCDRKVKARGLCERHYQAWYFQNRKG